MAIKKCCQATHFRILKLLSLATGSLLSILFNVGCANKPNEAIPSYGMPTAEYKVTGTVRSVDLGQPIKGIFVTLNDSLVSPNDSFKTLQMIGSAITDSLGNYLVTVRTSGYVPENWILLATDVDSSANGSFFPKDTILSMPDSAFIGASGDNLGLDSQNVDLNLDRITR